MVREIALAFPGVEEGTLHGAPTLKVAGRLLACPALHKSAEPSSLMVRISFEERAKLLAADLSLYYVTDHYKDYPSVLVRLPEMDRQSLRDFAAHVLAVCYFWRKDVAEKATWSRSHIIA